MLKAREILMYEEEIARLKQQYEELRSQHANLVMDSSVA